MKTQLVPQALATMANLERLAVKATRILGLKPNAVDAVFGTVDTSEGNTRQKGNFTGSIPFEPSFNDYSKLGNSSTLKHF